MKIMCKCGSSIWDSSDYLHDKGHLIPDQDLEDLTEKIERSPGSASSTIWKHSKTIFQCADCACLILGFNNEYHFFSAHEPEKSKNAIRSVFGERWKRPPRGNWCNGKGSLWWGFGVIDQSADFDVASWDELFEKYHIAFERLKNNELLRDSSLSKDGVIVHEWSAKR
ncbi:MAG TPA: hypothetical protein PK011_00115 [Marinagarivorans sp.]|nr:hypothetical protein [Cellvibrionaceae bacterium]HMY37697.1 hypothetical protein [Marinagarivorans sp.]